MIYVLTITYQAASPEEHRTLCLRLQNGLGEYWAASLVPAESDPGAGVLEFEFTRRPLAPELLAWLRRVVGPALLGAWCHAKNDGEVLFSWEKTDE